MRLNNFLRRVFPVPLPGIAAGYASSAVNRGFSRSRVVWLCMVILAALCAYPATGVAAAPSGASGIEQRITQEQERAKARRASLSRLTSEERGVDKELAAAEVRILNLEKSLAKEEATLDTLAASDAELEAKGKALLAEQEKTEKAMVEALRVLWELHSRREGVKGRDLPDWPVTDREHTWSAELFAALDTHRKTLEAQQRDVAVVAAQRARIARDVNTRIFSLNKEKSELLQSRIRYEQRLADVRKEKQDTEKELSSIIALVRNLNIQLQAAEAQGDIAKAKGKLPWPAEGPVRGKFKPSAQPPVRGVTVALTGETEVRAVHWGKVVHNDILRGMGRVVILMHGEEYYSLYAFLAESPVAVGQDVVRGDLLGMSGYVTSLNGPGVYFELRHHQKAINPEAWLRPRTQP